MKAITIARLVTLGALYAPTTSVAQRLEDIQPGTQVRVWSAAAEMRGARARFVGRVGDASLFATTPRDTLTVPDALLNGVEVRSGQDVVLGLGVGLAAGALIGSVIGGLIGEAAVSGCSQFLCELDALGYAAGGLLIGGGLGALIGAASAPPTWSPVHVPRRRPTTAGLSLPSGRLLVSPRRIGAVFSIGIP